MSGLRASRRECHSDIRTYVLCIVHMPDDGREERPKHVANNKNTIIVLCQMVNVHMLPIGLRWAGYVAPMGEMHTEI